MNGINKQTTILNFNPNNELYQDFLRVKNLLGGTDNYRVIKCAGDIFKDFVKLYLSRFGLRASQEGQGTHISGDEIRILCQRVNIIEENENFDGYEPCLEFHATSEDLMVKGFLARNGSIKLRVLEDFLKLLPDGNGIEKPNLMFERYSNGQPAIKIASVEQIPRVVEIMKQIYGSVGKRKFGKLSKLLEKSYECENSKKIFEKYNGRLNDFFPMNLF